MENRIIVDFNALDRIAKKLNTAGSDLDAAMSILSGVYPTQADGSYLRLNGANISLKSVGGTVSAYNVTQAVQGYRSAIKRLGNHSRSLSSAVKQASASFRNTEAGTGRGLDAGEKAPSTSGAGNGGKSKSSNGSSVFQWTFEDWMELVGEGGIIGAAASGIFNLIYDIKTGGVPAKTVLSALKSTTKVTERIAKGVSAGSFDWLGLSREGVKNMSVGEALGKGFKDYSFKNAKNVSGKIAVGAKWLGKVLTVATTAYENFCEDEEGNSTGRKLAETVGESAVKILGGIAIGAVVSTIGAPAIVAGGITVVATWAIDKVFEAVTGKDAAEYISDTILDSVGSAAKKAGEAISGWWNRVTSGPKLAGAW